MFGAVQVKNDSSYNVDKLKYTSQCEFKPPKASRCSVDERLIWNNINKH